MNTRRWSPGALLAALACGALLGVPTTTAAQSTEDLLAQRRLEYRAARDAHEAARSAFSVVERQFSSALEEVTRARRSGDEQALERAFALVQDRSAPYRDQEERVNEARERLDRARQALIDIITVRLEELLAQMDAASSSQERARLDLLWRDLSNELEELEAEAQGALRLNPVVLPEITFDPRDGPMELEAKAQLLERRAAAADTVIQRVDREIQSLRDRERMERTRRDFLAATGRFDDTRVPVVTARPPGAGEISPDSTGAQGRPLTLEERIQELEAYRKQLESYRDQLLIRAQLFRQRIGWVAS
ncbi:MAG: hypothetical protein ACE5GJ_07685 [Gemmatimonadota bacterium]